MEKWDLIRTPTFANRFRKIEKRHRTETRQANGNLDTYVLALKQGARPAQLVEIGFVHSEQMGIHAIDQSPLNKGYKAIRLYVYPDVDNSELHLITMGDKDSQQRDVNECCRYVKDLRKHREDSEHNDS